MRSRLFGSRDVPIIGLGTWQMERDDPAQATAAIRRAIERGLTHVDTAEMYGNGKVETLVGAALAGVRDRVFLVSKVLPSNAAYATTLRACEASLERLHTDHLDAYLLHWRGDVPLAETFRAFETLQAQGKIRAWGVSNFDHDDLAEALALVGPDKIACNQVLYHLDDRTIEHDVIPWCEANGVAVVAYSPLGGRGGFPRAKALDAIARATGITPRQLALGFLSRKALVIPKAAQVAHVDELADTPTLDDAVVAELEAAFPLGPWRGLPSI